MKRWGIGKRNETRVRKKKDFRGGGKERGMKRGEGKREGKRCEKGGGVRKEE